MRGQIRRWTAACRPRRRCARRPEYPHSCADGPPPRRPANAASRAPSNESCTISPGPDALRRDFPCKRAGGRRAAREKIIEILHARPRGRFVVGIDVVPAKGRRVVHHTRTCIDALGRKIRAVAADAFVIIIARIAPVRPDVRIAHRRGTVVWQ